MVYAGIDERSQRDRGEGATRTAAGTLMQFEIEWAGVLASGRPVVIARRLAPGDVHVGPGATLGGCPLLPVVESVHIRLLDPDRSPPGPGLVGFVLADARDLPRLAAGQVVALTGPEAPGPAAP